MGTKLFLGFDQGGDTAEGGFYFPWAEWRKPPGVYHNLGVATQNQSVDPPGSTVPFSHIFVAGRPPVGGGTPDCGAYGNGAKYPGSVSYETYHTKQGFQLGITRSVWGIGDEIYLSCDLKWGTLPAASLATYTPNASYNSILKWGDAEIKFKSSTYNGGTGLHDVVFSVRNAGVEVATVTVPGINAAAWMYFKAHVKLHASSGVIDCVVNGYAQSAPYTSQNTISVTSLVSASHVYVGPPCADNNSNEVYVGIIDNVLIKDDAWPSGRPLGFWGSVTTPETLSGWAASNGGTLASSLESNQDSIQARGTGVGSSALLSIGGLNGAVASGPIHGIAVHSWGVSNRDLTAAKKLALGVSKSGVHQMGTRMSAINPPTDTPLTTPATYSTAGSDYFFDPGYVFSDIGNVRVRLLVEAAG